MLDTIRQCVRYTFVDESDDTVPWTTRMRDPRNLSWLACGIPRVSESAGCKGVTSQVEVIHVSNVGTACWAGFLCSENPVGT